MYRVYRVTSFKHSLSVFFLGLRSSSPQTSTTKSLLESALSTWVHSALETTLQWISDSSSEESGTTKLEGQLKSVSVSVVRPLRPGMVLVFILLPFPSPQFSVVKVKARDKCS